MGQRGGMEKKSVYEEQNTEQADFSEKVDSAGDESCPLTPSVCGFVAGGPTIINIILQRRGKSAGEKAKIGNQEIALHWPSACEFIMAYNKQYPRICFQSIRFYLYNN